MYIYIYIYMYICIYTDRYMYYTYNRQYAARRIYLICRRKNLACPRMVSWLVNQSAAPVPATMFLRS